MMPRRPVLAGVLVGGGGTRMVGHDGVAAVGVAKGLLEDDAGVPIILRTLALLDTLAIPHVLLGRHPLHAVRYDALDLIALDDEPPGIGPLGGLLALLRYAAKENAQAPEVGQATSNAQARLLGDVVLLGCDMPYLHTALLQRLIDAPAATAVAPFVDGRWQPMFARFDVAATLRRFEHRFERSLEHSVEPSLEHSVEHCVEQSVEQRVLAGATGLQGLLDELQAQRLPLQPGDQEALRDWDLPEDVRQQFTRHPQ